MSAAPRIFRATAGDQNRTVLLTSWSGESTRLTFSATLSPNAEGLIGDITILLGAAADETYFYSGYTLTTGSFWNQLTTFYRQRRVFARTEYSPVLIGQPNAVVVELHRGHFRYWLNGRIILEAYDPVRWEVPRNRWIGLRTWATDLVIEDLKIKVERQSQGAAKTP